MTIYVFWVLVFITVWAVGAGKIIPGPMEVLRSVPDLWEHHGLGDELWTSLMLNFQAIAFLIPWCLLVAYGSVVPLFAPIMKLFTLGRFNGFVGVPLLFALWLGNPHYVKVALLVFGAGVFTVPSLVEVIKDIPETALDHARTLRYSEWHILWEVVVLGEADHFAAVFRTNFAMIWMLVPLVEARYAFEGGIGKLMLDMERHLFLGPVYALSIIVLAVGFAQDWFINLLSGIAFDYREAANA
jgi:NitT/TauT family transport system permease protein